MSNSEGPGGVESKGSFDDGGPSEAKAPDNVGQKRTRDPDAWNSEEDGEFVPYTQSMSPRKIVYGKKSVAKPCDVQQQSDAKRPRGPQDCLNWDSDDDLDWLKPAKGKSSSEKSVASKPGGKSSSKKKGRGKNSGSKDCIEKKSKGV